MSFYADLAPCDYFGAEHASRFKAVGWLEEGSDFKRAKADPRFVHKLVLLLAEPNPLEPSADPYFCSICTYSRGPHEFQLFQSPGMPKVPMGNRNLFLPGSGFLYIAPSLILHYIDAHQYAPPEEFVKAVLECPPTRSQEFQNAVQANAPKGLFK